MAGSQAKNVSPDWVSKTVAGLVLGFTLAIGCAGLFSWLASAMPLSSRGQLAMWITAPVWMGVLSGVYFFRSGRHAWTWLAGANLLVFAIPMLFRLI